MVTRGFEDVGLDEIATHAGVSKRTLFNYFDSKEAILFDSEPGDLEHWEEVGRGVPAELAVWDAVGMFFVEFVSGSAAKLEVQRRVMLASPQLAGRSRAVSQRLHHFLRRWVERRLDATASTRFDTALLVDTALSVMATAFSAWNPDDGFDRYLALLRQGFASVQVEVRR